QCSAERFEVRVARAPRACLAIEFEIRIALDDVAGSRPKRWIDSRTAEVGVNDDARSVDDTTQGRRNGGLQSAVNRIGGRSLVERAGRRAQLVEMRRQSILDSRAPELRDQRREGVTRENPLHGGDASEG